VRCDLSTIRQFCLFLRRRDPKCFVPDLTMGPMWRQIPRHRPYIYSTDEVRLLLAHADELVPAFRGLTFRMMILMLYCTGIRPGEALRMQIRDVDLQTKALLVRKSKGKTRWVPFHAPFARRVRQYIAERKKIAPALPQSLLFTQPNGRPYSDITVCSIGRELLRKSGLKPARGRLGPRLYDLRHTYATHVLLGWYKEGRDLHAMLPLLSTYMGHDHLLGTQVYLTATPELLEIASRRFEERFHTQRAR
jgi:integrase